MWVVWSCFIGSVFVADMRVSKCSFIIEVWIAIFADFGY